MYLLLITKPDPTFFFFSQIHPSIQINDFDLDEA